MCSQRATVGMKLLHTQSIQLAHTPINALLASAVHIGSYVSAIAKHACCSTQMSVVDLDCLMVGVAAEQLDL